MIMSKPQQEVFFSSLSMKLRNYIINMSYKDRKIEKIKLLTEQRTTFAKNEDIPSKKIIGRQEKIKPLITIAIPTYRRIALLKEALISALHQENTICSYDIIIVDNDADPRVSRETEEMVRGFHSNITSYYRNSQNLGMFGNWNRCFELAEGDWVALLHDDDLLMPNYIESIYRLLIRKKDIGAICSNFIIANDIPENLYSPTKDRKKEGLVFPKKNLYRLRRIFPVESELWNYDIYSAPTCGILFNKEKVLKSEGFDENLYPSADWFFLYSFNRRYKVYKPLYPLGYYRVSVNESLNIQTIEGFIEDAGIFRDYAKNGSILSRLQYFLFCPEQHVFQVSSNLKTLESFGRIASDFDYVEIYKERKPQLLLYKMLEKLYFIICRIIAIIFG